MLELAFNFDTPAGAPEPVLTIVPGIKTAWTPRELDQVEAQLRSRYKTLAIAGGTIEFKGETLHIKKKDGDATRMPTLEIRVAPTALVRLPKPQPAAAAAPTLAPVPTDWYSAWLNAIEPLVLSEKLVPAEAAMLRVVRDELHSLAGKTPPRELALLALVAVLALAEQLSRVHQPDRPHPYSFALSGLQRLLDTEKQTPWGPLPVVPNPDPPPSWFGRFWHLLKGE